MEVPDKKSGRKVYQYIDSEGKRGKLVTRKQHVLDLKAQGKLLHISVGDCSFSTKRKRSGGHYAGDVSDAANSSLGANIVNNSMEPGDGISDRHVSIEDALKEPSDEAVKNKVLNEVDMGRQQVRLREKDCVPDVREDLEEHRRVSQEDFTQQEDVQGYMEEGVVGFGNGVTLLDSGYACSDPKDVESIEAAIKMKCDEKAKDAEDIEPVESGQVELIAQAMFEDKALSRGEKGLHLLGHLVCNETGITFPVSDLCTIGRDSSCSIMLTGREVSRLHTRVFFREGEVIMEKVSKLNKVRINDIMVDEVANLKDGDRVQVGEEILVWHREGDKQKEKMLVTPTSPSVSYHHNEANVVEGSVNQVASEDDDSVKLRNEILKKANAMDSLKLSSEKSEMKDVCKIIELFRSETNSDSGFPENECKKKLMELLANENSSIEDVKEFVRNSKVLKESLWDDIFQETLTFATRKTVLKTFPPDLSMNFCLGLLEEVKLFAPNLLSFVIKFCTKPNEPVTEKQTRKVLYLMSQLISNLNQKNSLFQKLVAVKLRLFSLTNAGLDFLSDIGVTQSSRSLQKDHDYLASLSKDFVVNELKQKSFNFLVDNLDKVIDGNLINFTSVILVAEPRPSVDLSSVLNNNDENGFFETGYLKLCQESQNKYMEAIVHILGKMLLKISPDFAWINKVLGTNFKHEMSELASEQTFWSYLALLPLSEQKNSDMVEILSYLNEFTLEIMWKTAENQSEIKALIDIIKNRDSSDEQVEAAESELIDLAEKKGLPSVLGDQLTYERAALGKKLRKGNITKIESFHLLRFRLAMFHALMAKVRQDYSVFLPTLSNILDKGNLAFFRARLSKHDISNDGDKIKKGNYSYIFDAIFSAYLRIIEVLNFVFE